MTNRPKTGNDRRDRQAEPRRQRPSLRRAAPPTAPSPFELGPRAARRSAEAELLADLGALVAAGLVEAQSVGNETRYALSEATSFADDADIEAAAGAQETPTERELRPSLPGANVC